MTWTNTQWDVCKWKKDFRKKPVLPKRQNATHSLGEAIMQRHEEMVNWRLEQACQELEDFVSWQQCDRWMGSVNGKNNEYKSDTGSAVTGFVICSLLSVTHGAHYIPYSVLYWLGGGFHQKVSLKQTWQDHILTLKAFDKISSQRSFPYVGLVLAKQKGCLFSTIQQSILGWESKNITFQPKAPLYTLLLQDKVKKKCKLWKGFPRPQSPPHSVQGWLFCSK